MGRDAAWVDARAAGPAEGATRDRGLPLRKWDIR
jgi:hypothetical protein